MKPKILLLPVVLFFLITSCTTVYINVISKNQDLNFNTNNLKTYTVVGMDGVSLIEFVKTFNKKYPQKRQFVNDFVKLFSTRLHEAGVSPMVRCDTSLQWNLIKSVAGSKEEYNVIDSLFTVCPTDYLISISNLEVTNRTQAYTTGGGVYMGTMTSSQEWCVINAQIQIIDRNTRKSVLEFRTSGQGSVFLFAFTNALEEAVNSAIKHSIAFLKTGQTKF